MTRRQPVDQSVVLAFWRQCNKEYSTFRDGSSLDSCPPRSATKNLAARPFFKFSWLVISRHQRHTERGVKAWACLPADVYTPPTMAQRRRTKRKRGGASGTTRTLSGATSYLMKWSKSHYLAQSLKIDFFYLFTWNKSLESHEILFDGQWFSIGFELNIATSSLSHEFRMKRKQVIRFPLARR